MRTRSMRSKLSLLFVAFAMMLALPAMALADTLTVSNELNLNTNTTKAPGDTGTANVWLDPTNGTPSGDTNGCNASTAAGQAVTVTLSSNNPAVTFPNGNTAQLTACGSTNAKQVSYKVAADAQAGTAVIKGTATGGKSGQTNLYNTADTLTVTISAPADSAAPTLHLPNDITEEATGPNGNVVTYTATADDADPAHPAVTCLPASGSTFAIGATTVNCSATDAVGNKATGSFTVTVQDTTKPELKLPANITEEATGPNGNTVTYSASASDLVDGSVNVSCTPNSGSTFAIDTTTVNCEATDAAGNKASGSFTVKVQDTIAPTDIKFADNISDGGSFFFGDVPAQPTCTATDSGSGLNSAGCVVSGYSTAVGQHTLKATATDNARNTATKEITYTVKPYTLNGFYQPIDMNGTVNTVKNGSTVPVKFELFKGTTELTNTSAVTSIKATPITCGALAGDPEDAIETTATGGTSLRYDATAGQFVYNWTTPKGASQVGKCYTLTMTAADSSTLIAYFKLK